MENIYELVQFELNEWISIQDWKIMSDEINKELKKAEGFISRDSAVDEKWNVYCIIKWEDKETQEKFMKEILSDEEWMKEFGKFANMKTMEMKTLNII